MLALSGTDSEQQRKMQCAFPCGAIEEEAEMDCGMDELR